MSSLPNEVLLRYAAEELCRAPGLAVVDLGCGAGRNAVPIATLGARVVGVDLSEPMLEAAVRRQAVGDCDSFEALADHIGLIVPIGGRHALYPNLG